MSGTVINDATVDAAKIAIEDLAELKADVAGIHMQLNSAMTSGSLYSGSKNAINSNNNGFFMDSSGQINMGNANAYIKSYLSGSTWKIDIKADEINLGGTGNIGTAINQASTNASNAATAAENAKKTATNYITTVTSGGIFVHTTTSSDPTNSNAHGVKISDTVDIVHEGSVVASYGSDATVGPENANHFKLSSTDFSYLYGQMKYFRVHPNRYNNSVTGAEISFGNPGLTSYSAYIGGYKDGGGYLTVAASSQITLSGYVKATNGISVSGSISSDSLSTGAVSCSSISCTSIDASGKIDSDKAITGNRIFTRDPSTGTSTTANARIIAGSPHEIGYTKDGSSRTLKHDVSKIEMDDIDPHRLYDAEVIQFTYNKGYLNDSDCRANRPLPGFIAEDLYKVYPMAVDVEEGKVTTWNTRYIIPPMLALIQEHKTDIDRLKQQITKLESTVAELKTLVAPMLYSKEN